MSRRPAPARPAVSAFRCAIYTRKSTEEGLEQEFNTLDAQRESGEASIASQAARGGSVYRPLRRPAALPART
ncbi:MAG TPA: hypothetical protein VFF69_15985 [Phycisphaerales bacterium]|nr:hypothetical protein [Phycisphaerales bacterium]